MTKILNTGAYNALKQKADNYDAVVAAVVKNNSGLTAEDVTPEVITEALNATGNSDDNTALQAQLDAALARATTAEERVREVETENANLLNTAAEDTAGLSVKGGEPANAPESIAAFADKNKGNTAAILTEMQKDGLI